MTLTVESVTKKDIEYLKGIFEVSPTGAFQYGGRESIFTVSKGLFGFQQNIKITIVDSSIKDIIPFIQTTIDYEVIGVLTNQVIGLDLRTDGPLYLLDIESSEDNDSLVPFIYEETDFDTGRLADLRSLKEKIESILKQELNFTL